MGMLRVPRRAVPVDMVECSLPSGDWAGHRAHVVRYQIDARYADGGTEYVSIDVEDGPRRAYRYSGRNIPDAARQLAELRSALEHPKAPTGGEEEQ